MTARGIIQALGGRWYGGDGTAQFPVHEDRNPSLSASERDGTITTHTSINTLPKG